jgi:hypothetical protein
MLFSLISFPASISDDEVCAVVGPLLDKIEIVADSTRATAQRLGIDVAGREAPAVDLRFP